MKINYLVALLIFWLIMSQGVHAKKRKDVSIQLYSVRDIINKKEGELKSILLDLAKMGYTSVETANYNNGKFYGKTLDELKKMVENAGMEVLSSHCFKGLSEKELLSGDFTGSLTCWNGCVAAHKEAGMKYIVCPGIFVPKSMKEMELYCNYFNEVDRICSESGIKFGYHNHTHEFQKVENKIVMLDYMIEHTDAAYVFY